MKIHNNERDVEIPAMLNFVAKHEPKSLLDVGAHQSHALYARDLRGLVEVYHGVDVQRDDETAAILDRYVTGNVLTLDLRKKYDMIVSLSSIEHCGISTYKAKSYRQERDKVFKKILRLSRRHVWLSFPVGPAYLMEGQYATIDDKTLAAWEKTLTTLKFKDVSLTFYLYDLESDSYVDVSRGEAMAAEYPPVAKLPAFCILEASKK